MTYIELNEFTKAIAKSDITNELQRLWGSAERWDVASTGCVANITPIFGYLWLMVAATRRHNNNKTSEEEPMFVTKLPSKGGSCGTVDILESGGFSFPKDPQAIAQQCKKDLGVICQPTEDLAPVDKELMRVRGLTNLMTNFPLVYASILSKRIAIGCTHCIVDVKLGQATKMLSPWMTEKQIKLVTKDYFNELGTQGLVIDNPTTLDEFKSLLSEVAGGGKATKFALKEPEQPWIVQKCSDSTLEQLEEVRWLLTNSGMPQCRAIGRQLILTHIDELINGTDDLVTVNDQNEYKKLYREVLPDICGVSDRSWEDLKIQWYELTKKLPKFKAGFDMVNKYLKAECYSELEKSDGQNDKDLKVITFGLYPYQLRAKDKPVTIEQMDAYALDKLFEWLCGDDTYDPEVGIWLHKLPGETVKVSAGLGDEEQKKLKKLKSCDLDQQPIISIFYRPSRCPESEVITKARHFLRHEVKLSLE